MSRTTNYIGLSEEAKKFLSDNKAEVIFRFDGCTGMFFEPVTFRMYSVNIEADDTDYIPNHTRTYVEVMQTAPWSGGPCIFTCLVDTASGERKFEWSEKEIYNCI